MTAQSTAIEKVRGQLIRIMQDEELKTAVELLAAIIKDIRKDPYIYPVFILKQNVLFQRTPSTTKAIGWPLTSYI